MKTQTRKPRNIDDVLSGRLQSRVVEYDIPVPPGVNIYVTDSNNGRYRSNIKSVTVPLWAYNHTIKKTCDDPEYVIYYVAHELAHAWVDANGESRGFVGGDDSMHGAKFYKEFKRLCPPHLWHYETEYKPRDAKRAGISTDPKTNEATAHGFEDVRPRMQMAAGPIANDINDVIKQAIVADPRIEPRLTDLREDEVKSYIRGWFQL